ncbi:MAG: hypothetical protein GY909_17135 [Oligoflexia bacterium]|nr:hypothetical protein [Oligoflexia bacterium]
MKNMAISLEKSPYQYHFGPENMANVLQLLSLGIGKRINGYEKINDISRKRSENFKIWAHHHIDGDLHPNGIGPRFKLRI